MRISVFNHYKKEISFDYKKIMKDIKLVFEKQFKTKKNVSLILVDLEEIHKINLDYRHLDRPTDVISFEEFDDDYLGEIFICIDKVYEQAQEFNHSNEREFAFLLCHGLLHLHGYDHMNEEDEKVMFALQEKLLDETIYKRN
ncbi:MAG: rRNA maturation RNase YbeY [Bacilli bacterium]|nr:rRNA maturation RNase YbeY [Bacilli bacterium]